jgi:hypothetical protein
MCKNRRSTVDSVHFLFVNGAPATVICLQKSFAKCNRHHHRIFYFHRELLAGDILLAELLPAGRCFITDLGGDSLETGGVDLQRRHLPVT